MNRSPDAARELRRAYLFADMSEPHLQTLVNGMQDIHLDTGTTLFRQGQPAERF